MSTSTAGKLVESLLLVLFGGVYACVGLEYVDGPHPLGTTLAIAAIASGLLMGLLGIRIAERIKSPS